MKSEDVLRAANHAQSAFGSLISNNQCSRRDILRQVEKGMLKSIGTVNVCDDDGCVTDRESEGFVLTDAGKSYIDEQEGR